MRSFGTQKQKENLRQAEAAELLARNDKLRQEYTSAYWIIPSRLVTFKGSLLFQIPRLRIQRSPTYKFCIVLLFVLLPLFIVLPEWINGTKDWSYTITGANSKLVVWLLIWIFCFYHMSRAAVRLYPHIVNFRVAYKKFEADKLFAITEELDEIPTLGGFLSTFVQPYVTRDLLVQIVTFLTHAVLPIMLCYLLILLAPDVAFKGVITDDQARRNTMWAMLAPPYLILAWLILTMPLKPRTPVGCRVVPTITRQRLMLDLAYVRKLKGEQKQVEEADIGEYPHWSIGHVLITSAPVRRKQYCPQPFPPQCWRSAPAWLLTSAPLLPHDVLP